MPWRDTDAVDQRRQFVILARNKTRPISRLCEDFGISRKTGYKWLGRYGESGSLNGLEDRSRAPKSCPHRTSRAIERRVVALRRRHGWGARKLRELLLRRDVDVPVATINRILSREGLIDHTKTAKPATKRFEREHPNELWQMDFKGEYRLDGNGWCYPLTILDDHSRFLLGLFALGSQKRTVVQPRLVEVFEEYGLPQAMLMDHGTPWCSMTNGHGLTRLSVWLIEQDIRLIYGAVRHPQTQGKIERLHRSLNESLQHRGCRRSLPGYRQRLRGFREEYNTVRPHEALDMAVPADRYTPSRREYDPTPRLWEYPEGADVRRLDPQGKLAYGARQYFVCEALADRHVRCQEFAGKLLVSFRDTGIREIELATARTTAVVRPAASW